MPRPFWLLGLALSSFFAATAHAQQAAHGTLTLIVRDDQDQRVPGMPLTLIHDSDDGRVRVGTQTTDQAGAATWPDLAYGLYIVQFGPAQHAGRAMLPVPAQNLGMLDDGSGFGGGFGIRVVEPDHTELFVVGVVSGAAHLVPMFDLAPNAAAPPQRVDPLLAQVASPAPSPALSAAPPPGGGDSTALILVGGLLGLASVGMLIGWLKSRQPPSREDYR